MRFWLLLLLLFAVPIQATDWWNSTWNYRLPANATNSVYERNDTPLSVTVNFTQLIISKGINGVFDDNSVRVIEYNSTGHMVPYNSTATDLFQYEVPSQLEKAGGFNNRTNAVGAVHWILNGTLAENATRYYYVYFDANVSTPVQSYATDLNWTQTTFRNSKLGANFTNASVTWLSYLSVAGNWSDEIAVVNFTGGQQLNNTVEANCTLSGGPVRQTYDCRVNGYEVKYTFYSLASFFEFQVNGTNSESYDLTLYTTIPDSAQYSNRLAHFDANYTENYTSDSRTVYSSNATVSKGWLAWYDTSLSAVAYCLWNVSYNSKTRLGWENKQTYNRTILSIGSNDTVATNISHSANLTLTIGFEPGGEHSRADLAYSRLLANPYSLAQGAVETNTLLDLVFTPSYAHNGSNINVTMYLTGGRNSTDIVFFNVTSPNSTTWLLNASFALFGNSTGNVSVIFNDTKPAGAYSVFAWLETDRGINRTETFTLCRPLNTSFVVLSGSSFRVGLGDFARIDMTIQNSSLLCSNAVGSGNLKVYAAGDTIAKNAEFIESGDSTIYVSTPTSTVSKTLQLIVRGAVIGARTLTIYVAEPGVDPWFSAPVAITVSQNVHGMDVTPGLGWPGILALVAAAILCLSGRLPPARR